MVYVVDDDSSVCTALARFLKSSGLNVRTFPSAETFLEVKTPADVAACLVLDVKMPGISGIELQEELQRRQAGLPIVFISGHGTLPMAVKAMRRGAIDFLEKPLDSQALLSAVTRAIERAAQRASTRAVTDELIRRYRSLTRREREVFAEVIRGSLNKQIALRLGIGEKTVKVHRARVMRKMQAGSVADLVRMAVTCSSFLESSVC
jgi:FixJ family two-component response regulator